VKSKREMEGAAESVVRVAAKQEQWNWDCGVSPREIILKRDKHTDMPLW
jgi:hypothetical protein